MMISGLTIYILPIVVLNLCYVGNSWVLEPEELRYHIDMGGEIKIPFNISGSKLAPTQLSLKLLTEDPNVANFNGNTSLEFSILIESGFYNNSFVVQGEFLGRTHITATLYEKDGTSDISTIDIIVVRQQQVLDKIFTVSIAVLVSLIYVNFGCVLSWPDLKSIVQRPIGPAIGFIGQYLVLPLFSYGFGHLFFSDRPDMRLGLLFVGVSPAGGASNIWTYVLDGNIDLSITMTTITTLAAFGMMPLWLFTLGAGIFKEARIAMPYTHIATLALALFIPLLIGLFVKTRYPRVAAFLVRALKGFAALLIVFIIIFATVTNLYLFQLFSWRIIGATALLPWCGFAAGAALAVLARRSYRDAVAISIESGIENTGIAIFLLRFSLPQPQADLTTVVPVACAMLTPLPLAVYYIYRRFTGTNKNSLNFSSEYIVDEQR